MDLRRASPVWDEDFEQLTRSMQERVDDFFRASSPLPSSASGGAAFPADTLTVGGVGGGAGGVRGRLETQPDGSVLYRVTFDVRGYGPQDLKTSLVGDRTVRVCGAANRKDPLTGQQTSASFDKQFTLPDNVDPAKLRSLVANEQLTVSAPVLPPQYQSIGGRPQQQQQRAQLFTASPRMSPRSTSPNLLFAQPVAATSGQQRQQQGVRTASAYQLEVDVGREFEPQDLTVATADGGRRLTVHGRREVKAAGKTSMREFKDEFDLPVNVDAGRVTARLRSDGRVVVDMPLLRETAGFTYWPVAVDHRS